MKKIFAFAIALLTSLISFAQPANDLCSGALPINPNNGCVVGTTVAASDNWVGAIGCQGGGTNVDVWYSFTAINGQLDYDVTTSGAWAGDVEFILVSATSACTGLGVVGSDCGPSVLTGTVNGLQIGTLYYITISTPSGGTPGDFTLCIDNIPAPITPGQDCATAAILCDDSPFSQTTSSAGFGTQEINTANSCWGSGGERQSKWFKFTVGCPGTIEFNINPVISGNDYDWALFDVTSGVCPSTASSTPSAVACNWSGCKGSTGISTCADIPNDEPGTVTGGAGCFGGPAAWSTTVINATAGQTYALLVDNFSASNSGFTLTFGGACGGGTALIGPDANFGYTNPSCGVYNFTKTCQTTNSTFLWTFGDGSTSNLQNPSHTYTTTGTFTAVLEVTDALGCTRTSSETFTVNFPVATATPNPDLICSGETTNIVLSSNISPTTYSWIATDNPNVTGEDLTTQSSTTIANTLINTSGTPQVVTYTVTPSAAGCVGPDVLVTVTVNPIPVVTFTALADLCIDAGVQTGLGGGSPVGGVYSGTGVTDDGNGTTYSFDPAAAGVGTHTITYDYTDGGGCSGSANDAVEVFALPVVTFTALADLCIDAGVQTGLGGGSPVGGVYSGAGVTDDGNGTTYSFDPAAAGVGIHTITYDFTDGNGCSGSANDAVEVFALPVVTFTALADLCIDSGVQAGLGGGSPVGGVYSGTGVTDDGNGTTYSFDPLTAGVGIHTITYSFTNGNGCSASANDDVEVFLSPTVTFTALADLCIDAGVQTGLGSGSPAGGVYSGTGVTDDGNGTTYSFDPAAAGVGTHTITYDYTDGGGCSGSANDAVEVFPLPVVTFTALADLCIDAGVQTGLGGGSPVGGVYSGTGVTDDGNGTTYSFDPAAAGVGTHTITYNFTDGNGCSGSANDAVEVFALPVVTFTALADLCIDAGVQAGLGGGSPVGGVYSGAGVTDDGNGTTYSFDPAAAGVGTHTITYSFTNGNGCSASANDAVEVFALPVVTFTALADLCIDSGVQAGLGGGSPTGGVYSGAGVTDDGNGTTYSFDPLTAGVGIHTITYSFTNVNGCSASANDDVEVFLSPTVTFTALADLCIDAGVQTGLGGGSPVGGVYSGTGVTDDGNGTTYSFDPAAAGVGTHTITYTFGTSGCSGLANDNVEVFALPVVTFTALADLCIDAGVQTGLGGGSPVGGIYSGAGVTDDGNGTTYSFDPAAAGVGIHTITYNFTDGNGCSGSANDAVEVFAVPVVTFTALADLCVDAGVQTGLGSGSPVGGVYSGTGVTDDGNGTTYSFDPAAAGVGTHTITYSFTNGNGCSASANDAVEVFAVPVVTFTALADLCVDAGVQTGLGSGSPVGGVYSGTGVTDDGNGTTYSFDPAAAGVGTHTITYNFTNGGGCSGSANDAVEVFALPVVTFTALTDLCIDAGVQTGLGGGSPVGGVYSGTGVTDDGNGTTYSFDPATAGVGIHTITYSFTNGNGCSASANDAVEVFALPIVTFTALADLCIDAGVQTGLGGGSPTGGVYSGAGVTDDGNGTTYSFDPAAAGVGIHTITYSFTNGNGCSASANDAVEVSALPVVSFTALADFCIGAGVQTGLGGGSPAGGIYSGAGVTDDGNGTTYSFDPAAAGVGIHTITYSFTNGNGCSASANDDVEVFASPVIAAVMPVEVCDSFTLPVITGTDLTAEVSYWDAAGGTGNQYSDGNVITNSMTIFMFDSNGACSSEESFTITVNVTPLLDQISDTTVCNSYTLPTITGTNLTGNQAYYNDSQLNGGTIISGPITSTQTVWIYDSVGTCSDETSYLVTINTGPTGIISGGGTYCEGDVVSNVVVDVTGTPDWTINFTVNGVSQVVTGSSSPIILGNTEGTYELLDVTDGGCSSSLSGTATIVINPTPAIPFAGTDAEYCSTGIFDAMTATGNGGTFTWYSDPELTNVLGTGNTFTPLNTDGISYYYVTETINGCEGPSSDVQISIVKCEIAVPTGFTPNSDQVHDTWELYNLDSAYPDNVVRIYNRWGNILFESTPGAYNANQWDGTYKGELMPVGSYYYIIQLNNDEDESLTGTVTIILD